MSDHETGHLSNTDAESAPKPGWGRGLSAPLRVIYAPGGVLDEVRRGLPWWPGLVLVMLITLILALSLLPLQTELMAGEIRSGEMAKLELNEDGSLPDPVRYGLFGAAFGGALLGVPLMLLAISFFYWLALLVTFGGAPFRRLFTLAIYTSFIGLLFQVCNLMYIKFGGVELTRLADFKTAGLDLSLAALMDSEGILTNLLRALGVFQIWELLIFIAGVALLMKRGRGAVAGPVLAIFVLGALVGAFLGTLSGSFGG